MSLFDCNSRCSCTFFAVIASVALGVVTAFLQITGTITVAPVFSWVFFGIALLFLVVTLGTLSFNDRTAVCRCRCTALNALLIGALGTIVSALVILAFAFVATSIIGAVFLGLELFFFFLFVFSSACFVRCLFGCGE
ncbi:MAG: hypothetical protein J6Q74_02170 [Clostridia bacterium]|nr:hypothetical protein [Clostridia bacterium]